MCKQRATTNSLDVSNTDKIEQLKQEVEENWKHHENMDIDIEIDSKKKLKITKSSFWMNQDLEKNLNKH